MNIRIFVFCLILGFGFSCKKENDKIISENGNEPDQYEIANPKMFHIVKLTSYEKYHLIYAKKRNSYYKILSINKNHLPNCDKIEQYHNYDLKLKSLVPDTSKTPLLLKGVEYGGIEVLFEGDSIRDIYRAENLNGLCNIGVGRDDDN